MITSGTRAWSQRGKRQWQWSRLNTMTSSNTTWTLVGANKIYRLANSLHSSMLAIGQVKQVKPPSMAQPYWSHQLVSPPSAHYLTASSEKEQYLRPGLPPLWSLFGMPRVVQWFQVSGIDDPWRQRYSPWCAGKGQCCLGKVVSSNSCPVWPLDAWPTQGQDLQNWHTPCCLVWIGVLASNRKARTCMQWRWEC